MEDCLFFFERGNSLTGLEYDPGINVQGPEETTTAVSTDTGPGYITEDVTVAPTTTDTTVSVTQTSESRTTTSVLSTDQADAASVNLTTDDSAAGDGGERLFTASVRSSGETSSSDDPITDFEGWCEENEIDINVLRDYLDGLFLTEAQFLTRLAIEGISADDFFNNSEIQFDTTGGFYIEQSNGTKLYFFSRTDDFNASDREQLNLLAGLLGGSIVKDTGRWYEATKYYFVDADGNEFRIDISYRDHFHYHGTVVYLEDVKEGDDDITFYIGGSNGAARGGWPITIEQDDDGVYSTIIVEGEDVTESFRNRDNVDNALFGMHTDLNYAATLEFLNVEAEAILRAEIDDDEDVAALLANLAADNIQVSEFLAALQAKGVNVQEFLQYTRHDATGFYVVDANGAAITDSDGDKIYFFQRESVLSQNDAETLAALVSFLSGTVEYEQGWETDTYSWTGSGDWEWDSENNRGFWVNGDGVRLQFQNVQMDEGRAYQITLENGTVITVSTSGNGWNGSLTAVDDQGVAIDLYYGTEISIVDEVWQSYLPAVAQDVSYSLQSMGMSLDDFINNFLKDQNLTLLQFRALFQGKNTMGAFFKFLKEQVGLTDFETWMTDKDTNLSDFLTYFSDTDCSLTEFVNVLAAQNISIAAFFDVDKEDDVDKEAIIFDANGFQITGEKGTTPIDFFDDEMIDLLNLRAREEVESFSRFLEGEIREERHWWYGTRLVWYGEDEDGNEVRDVLGNEGDIGTWRDPDTGRKLRFTISTDRTVLTIGLEESDKTLRVTRNEYTNEIESVIDTASGQDVMARYTDTYTYGGVTYSSYGRGFAQAVNEGALARYEVLYGSLKLDGNFRGKLADTDLNVNGLTEDQFLDFLDAYDLTLNDFYARLAEYNLSIGSFFQHAQFDAENNNFFLVDILDADNNKIYLFDENSKDNLTPEARALLDNLVIFAEGEVEERFNKFLGFLWDTTSKGFYWNGIKMQSVDGGGYLWTDEDGHEMNLQVSRGSDGRVCYEVSGGGLELRIEMGDGKEGSLTTITNLQTGEDITISDLANYGKTTGFNHAALVELDTLVDTPIVEEEIGVTLAEYGFSRMEFAQFLLDIMGNDGYGDEEGFLYTYFQELKDAGTYETRAQAFLLFLKEKEGLSFDRFLSLLQEKDISLADFAFLTRIDATNGRLYVVGLDGKEIDNTSRMYSFEDYLDSYVDLLTEADRATIDSITKFCDGRVYKKWVWDGGMTWFWEGADGRTVRMDDMDYGSTTWEDLDTGVVLEIYDHNKIRLGNGNVIQFSFEGEGGLFSGGTLSGAEDITTTDDITDITDDLYAKEAVYAKRNHSDTWAVINSNVRALQELTAVVHSEDPLTFDYMMEFLTQSGLEFDEVLSGLKYENGRPYILDDAGNKLFLFNEEQVNIFGVSEVELERLLSFLNGQIFEHAGLLYWTDNAGTLRVIDGQLQRGEGGGYFNNGVSVNPLTINVYDGTSIDDDGNVVLLQDNMSFLVERDSEGNLSVSYAGRMINADNFEEITSYMGQAVFRVVNSEALAYFWDKSVDILNRFILQYTVIYMHLDTVVNELRAIRERDSKDKEKLAEERTERAKTEKRLLEAMQEREVTLSRQTYALPNPFFVMATENPLEVSGVYSLPEAQIDRFLFKLLIGYPDADEEKMVLRKNTTINAFDSYDLKAVLNPSRILELQAKVKEVFTSEAIEEYIIKIVEETRKKDWEYAKYISYGASPRASIALFIASKAEALMHGRDYVTPEDVKTIVYPVLRHRIILNYEAEAEEITTDKVISHILSSISAP